MVFLKEHHTVTLRHDFDLEGLEAYLNALWVNRHALYDEDSESGPTEQGFLTFLRNQQIKSTEYIGFLQYADLKVCIYPKVFPTLDEKNIALFYKHLVYWLSYCRRINFPFNNVLAELSYIQDFPEALIHFFAKRTLGLLQRFPYHQFDTIEETMSQVRGRLLTPKYINESITKGNYQKLICEHEPLQFDNVLNRIIKSVTRKLIQRSKFKETWFYLEQILFVLEDVADEYVIARDCDRIRLNPMFTDYQDSINMCRFFLNNEQVENLRGVENHFCFMIPMNYVFEDYICGFIEDKFKPEYKAIYQYGGWLTDQKVFRINSDIVLMGSNNELLLIIDTKYKLRQRNEDAKKGISQSDLYQMLAYAVRHNCRKVLLLYPVPYGQPPSDNNDIFTISSPLFQGKDVKIIAADLQICVNRPEELDQLVYDQLNAVIELAINT